MMAHQGDYSIGLDRNAANYVPLSPISFLKRSAAVYPNHPAVVYEGRSWTWSEVLERCRRFASMLAARGLGRGDTVAAMLPNIPAMNDAHFAVPMAGCVLNALNIRLEAATIAFMLDHGGAKLILVDPEFADVVADALTLMKGPKPYVVDVPDASFAGGRRVGDIDYEAWLTSGDPNFEPVLPEDEWDAIALSYTSGTTGNPKGVVTHHRGAYLNAVSNEKELHRLEIGVVGAFARGCRDGGMAQFCLLSAVGSTARSRFRYVRIMGMKEDTVRETGFPRLAVFRPGIIVGNAHTPGWVAGLGRLVPGKYGNIDQQVLGRSIAAEIALHSLETGEVIRENAAMREFAAYATTSRIPS